MHFFFFFMYNNEPEKMYVHPPLTKYFEKKISKSKLQLYSGTNGTRTTNEKRIRP